MHQIGSEADPPPERFRRRIAIGDILIGVVLLSGVLLTAANARRIWFPGRTRPDRVLGYDVAVGPRSRTSGALEPKLTVIVFSDYQCGACRRLDDALVELLARHPDDLAISWRQWPLDIHPRARAAAAAAICASREGVFAMIHRMLFDSAAVRDDSRLAQTAARAGVRDRGAFVACLADRSVRDTINADIAAAKHLSAEATPTIIVGRAMYTGYSSDIPKLIEAAIRRQ